MSEPKFEQGNDYLDELLAAPGIADKVAEVQEANRALDRSYAMNLAMIRAAADKTQAEIAEKMHVSQGVVSKLERRDNMLLSTFLQYLNATGADDVRIVVSIHGQEIEVDLDRFQIERTQLQSP
jgi:DNA-binding XRE family transcriptional regulator